MSRLVLAALLAAVLAGCSGPVSYRNDPITRIRAVSAEPAAAAPSGAASGVQVGVLV